MLPTRKKSGFWFGFIALTKRGCFMIVKSPFTKPQVKTFNHHQHEIANMLSRRVRMLMKNIAGVTRGQTRLEAKRIYYLVNETSNKIVETGVPYLVALDRLYSIDRLFQIDSTLGDIHQLIPLSESDDSYPEITRATNLSSEMMEYIAECTRVAHERITPRKTVDKPVLKIVGGVSHG